MGTHKDLGSAVTVMFHTHRYLNRGGHDADVQNAHRWYNGYIKRYGYMSPVGKRLTARRLTFKPKRTDLVTDRMIYLFADHDLSDGKQRIHVCAVLHADPEGNVSIVLGSKKVRTDQRPLVTIPTVINGTKIKYFALASKIQIAKPDVDTWIKHFAADTPPEPGYDNVGYQIGWVDFEYLHTLLGTGEIEVETGTDEDGEIMTETVSALRFPVLDPLQMANRHADRLRTLLRQYEREFGFHKTLINQSKASIDEDVKKWAKYRLALMLHTAQNPTLKKKVDAIRHAGLGAFIRSRTLVQESYQAAVDLAAGNLAGWLQRDVVQAWITLNHSAGAANISQEASAGTGRTDPIAAKICVLEDFARAIRDLHQTRPGNVLAEVLAEHIDDFPALDEYLFNGKAMKEVLKARKVIGSVMRVKKLVLGRLIARGKANFVDVLKQQGGYLTDADVLKSTDELFEAESAFLKWLVTGSPSTLTEENLTLNQARIQVDKLTAKLGSVEAASGVLSLLGWLSVMESIRAYSEIAGKRTTKDHLRLSATIAAQGLATTQLMLGDTLKKASKAGLKVSLSALGVVVNVIDAGLKAKEADELATKGDTDAALLTVASAALIMLSIPFGLLGFWVGTALAIVAGILGLIASWVTDDTWDTFLNNTPFGLDTGGGSWTPDWAGVTLDALKANTAFQVRALANLLDNFSVKRLGGGTGKRFGAFTLELTMTTPDPMAVFLLTWHFRVSGEPGVETRVTVASTFTGAHTPADGKNFRVPGILHTPDGKKSLESFEHAAVKAKPGSTVLTIGDPHDMRPDQTPNHRWQGRTITGLKVEVRRLLMSSFGRPRAEDKEWTPTVTLDLSLPPKEAKLFKG